MHVLSPLNNLTTYITHEKTSVMHTTFPVLSTISQLTTPGSNSNSNPAFRKFNKNVLFMHSRSLLFVSRITRIISMRRVWSLKNAVRQGTYNRILDCNLSIMKSKDNVHIQGEHAPSSFILLASVAIVDKRKLNLIRPNFI